MKILIIALSISCSVFSFSQNDTIQINDNIMEFEWELDIEDRECENITEPQFPGGEVAMFKFISDSLKLSALPDTIALISSIYYVRFTIETNGSISSFECFKGNEITCNDIYRMLEKMPLWTPGMYCGEAKRTRYTLPIHIYWR